MNSLKEMNELYNVCKEDLVKENTIIWLHRGAKLEKFRQHNLNWVVNHIGLKNQNKHISVINDISSESSYVPPSNKRKISLSPVMFSTSVEEFDDKGED
jgi:hypothetical protein